MAETEKVAVGKKMGVWVNGKLGLQTRNRDAIDDYAQRKMRERNNVWVAPIGSFVPAKISNSSAN